MSNCSICLSHQFFFCWCACQNLCKNVWGMCVFHGTRCVLSLRSWWGAEKLWNWSKLTIFFCSCVKFGQIRFSFAWAIYGDFESLGCALSVVCHKPIFLFVVSVSDRLWFSLKSFIALQLFSVSSDDIWSNCSDTRLSQILVDSLLLSKLIVYYQAAGVDVFSCYWVCAQISQYKVFNYVLCANFPNLRFFPFLFQLQE